MTADRNPATVQTQLDDFEIGPLLGEGGSATVCVAIHRTFGGRVALKRWREATNESFRRRFLEECRLQWQLSEHPNIVRLYWADAPADGPPWLAMELYEQSLVDRLAHHPPLSVAERLDVVDDLLAGLAAIHESNHLHRDVKPANVLLKGGRAALGDLGLSMALDDVTIDRAAGTGSYVAPELLHDAVPDFRTDVYSAGRTIEAAFGADLPPWLDSLVTRATSADPADRPADARAFLDSFRRRRPAGSGSRPNPVAGGEADHGVHSGPGSTAGPASRRRRLAPGLVPRGRTGVSLGIATLAAAALTVTLLTPAGGWLTARATHRDRAETSSDHRPAPTTPPGPTPSATAAPTSSGTPLPTSGGSPTGGTSGSSPERTGSDTTPKTTPSSPPGTTPRAPLLPVSLRVNKSDEPLPRSVTVTVNRAAESGRHYWLLLRVAYSSSDVEYYGQGAVTAPPPQAQRIALQFPASAEPDVARKAVIWAAPAAVERKLKDQQKQPLESREFLVVDDCPDCEVIDPVVVSGGKS